MGELIGAFAEMIASLFALIAEAMPVILELLVYAVMASFLIIAYFVWPGFRRQKRNEWAGSPVKKYVDLGVSAVCLCALMGLGVWLVSQSQQPHRAPEIVEFKEGTNSVGTRLRIMVTTGQGSTNEVIVSVKQGGLKKIFKTASLHELEKAVQENVKVRGAENKQPPAISETNRPSSR